MLTEVTASLYSQMENGIIHTYLTVANLGGEQSLSWTGSMIQE